MMWAVRLIGSLSILAAGITCARSANDGVEGLESCFQAARVADGICSKLSDDPAKRLDCLQKTRTAQLECIEHAQSEPAPQNSSKSPSSGTPASAALAESSTEEASSKQTGDTDTFRPSTEGNLPQESNSPPTSNPETKPLELSKQTGDTDSFRPSTERNLPQESNSPPTSNPETKPLELSKQTGDTDSFRSSTERNLPQASNSPPTSNPETKPPELSKQTGDTDSFRPSTEGNLPQESNSPPTSNPETKPLELSKQTGDTDSFRSSTERNLPQASNSPPASNPETKPPELSKQTGDTDSFRPSTEGNLPQESNSPPTSNPETKPPELPAPPQATIRSDLSPKPAEHPTRPTATDWVVSETTSPIDYSPLVIAVIHSTSQAKDAANTLIMRCRGQRTELLVRTDGQWATTRGSELHGEYQINDQPMVALQWILSSDGKTATYKDDPVGLLQSLPDGARFKINIPDRSSSSHEATFRLDGWDAVRKKIGAACKWRPTADNASLGKR
jgi:hypothetical protein